MLFSKLFSFKSPSFKLLGLCQMYRLKTNFHTYLQSFTIVCCLFFVFAFTFSSQANAHQLSTSYINLKQNKETHQYTGDWQLKISDLEQLIAFDIDGDKQISWAEIKSKTLSINEFVMTNVQMQQDDSQCQLSTIGTYQLDHHYNESYLVVPITFDCLSNASINITYSAFFNIDENHKAIVNINDVNRVLSKNTSKQVFDATESSYLVTFYQYVYQGVLHIWMGIDHVLFLITLLLTSVLTRKKDTWQGTASTISIIKQTAWVITAFTLAHSITLTATALNLINFSSRWVELGIALSVFFAAINNVWPLFLRLGWITFAFGLLHGMGFASVLKELGLSSSYQLLSVVAFNVGVELGQLAILIITLPVLIWARHFVWYRKWAMPAASLIIAAIAIQWCIERF